MPQTGIKLQRHAGNVAGIVFSTSPWSGA